MLSRLPEFRIVPPEPGRPAVPYRAAQTVCGARPAEGYWRTSCSTGRMKMPTNGGVKLPEKATVDGYEEVNGVTYVIYRICRSVFVQTSPPGAVVCTTYPEQQAEPAVAPSPARVVYDNVFGWDAGANSEDQLDGDVSMRLTMDKAIGVVVGLTAIRGNLMDIGNYARMSHALYFHQNEGGRMQACAMEAGRRVSPLRIYTSSDAWEVRRVGSTVDYLHNGTRFLRSQVSSTGMILVGCAMYGTGDFIA